MSTDDTLTACRRVFPALNWQVMSDGSYRGIIEGERVPLVTLGQVMAGHLKGRWFAFTTASYCRTECRQQTTPGAALAGLRAQMTQAHNTLAAALERE